MATTINVDGRLFSRICCGKCGIEFYVPKAFDAEQRELGPRGGWHCPNGHSRVYRESESDRLRRERDQLKQRQGYYEDQIRGERAAREAAERSAAARKGQITKLKKRASAGVCPCCSRSFANLRKHMASQHPGYTAEEVT